MVNIAKTDNINNAALVGGTSEAKRALDNNYQDFLKLLTTQLQNQDPTAPLDTNDLTQQIATLSQVEQQIQTNDNLNKLLTAFATTQYNSVVSYIGKQIEAPGDVGALENDKALFSYYLEREAAEVKVIVRNETGAVVYEGPGSKVAGRNQFTWDGKNKQGEVQPDGIYHLEVKAIDGSKNSIISKTYTTGIVTAVDSIDGAVYLSFGGISVPIQSVISVRQAPQEQQG